MSDDRLFRWNFKSVLRCTECEASVFLEEVVSQEIFCGFCGYVLARNKSEWPVDWDENALFGATSAERGWGQGRLLPRSTGTEDIQDGGTTFEEEGDSAMENNIPSDAVSLASTTTDLNRLDTSYQSQEMQDVIVVERRHRHSTEAGIPASSIPSTPHKQMSYSASVSPPARGTPTTTARLTPPAVPSPDVKSPLNCSNGSSQIGTTPPHPLDSDLLTLALKFNLREPVVIAAKQIILRHESDLNKAHRSVIARAVLFTACRQLGIAKTFNEFDAGLDHQKKGWWHKVFKSIDVLLKKESLAKKSPIKTNGTPNNIQSPIETTCHPTTAFSVQDFIHSESKLLGLTPNILSRALEISSHPSIDSLFGSKRPSAIAAVILSFAAECEEFYIGTAPYAVAANVSTHNIAQGQKQLLRCVEEMAGMAGELPRAFRAKWNTPGYERGDHA